MDAIYFVTVMYLEEKSDTYKRIRCWGWYPDQETAEKAILENWTDIYENGYYNYAVVEKSLRGVCNSCIPVQWFKVDPILDAGGFIADYDVYKIDTPPRFKSIAGFSFA